MSATTATAEQGLALILVACSASFGVALYHGVLLTWSMVERRMRRGAASVQGGGGGGGA